MDYTVQNQASLYCAGTWGHYVFNIARAYITHGLYAFTQSVNTCRAPVDNALLSKVL